MTREAYHKALSGLQNEVLQMAEMVGSAVKESIEALKDRDMERSKAVVRNDIAVNRKRFVIEERCIQLIATQQPMAVDLRTIASIINIITDLERIGDHAEGIAKISVSIGNEPLVKPLVDMPVMAEQALSLLPRCMQGFVDRDVEAARKICNEDDVVDALYDKIYAELVHLMIKDPKIIKDATFLIWAA